MANRQSRSLLFLPGTGGLYDSIKPYIADTGDGNGFTFAAYNADDMLYVMREAESLYRDDPEAFGRLVRKVMKVDFSWSASAAKYIRLYSETL